MFLIKIILKYLIYLIYMSNIHNGTLTITDEEHDESTEVKLLFKTENCIESSYIPTLAEILSDVSGLNSKLKFSIFDGTNLNSILELNGSGDVNINGKLNVTGATSLSSTLSVVDTITLGTPASGIGGIISTGNGTITIDPSTVGDNTGNVIIAGGLTVNGTTTSVNSNTVSIGDNIIVLNGDETGAPSQNGGIEIERGTSTNVSFFWNETTDTWSTDNQPLTTGSGNMDVGGTLDVTGPTSIDGDFDVATDKFTVASATGNTAIAGTLDVTGATGVDGDFDVATNKFTVASGTGNTAVAGTLDVDGVVTFGTAGNEYVFPSTKGTNKQILKLSDSSGTLGWSTLILDELGDVSYNITTTYSLFAGTIPSNLSNAQYNVSLGYQAVNDLTTGDNNTSIGFKSLFELTTGSNNTAIGTNAAKGNVSNPLTGSGNTCLGASSGIAIHTGATNNTLVGYSCGAGVTTGTNLICLGANTSPSSATASNEITLGDSNITAFRCADTSLVTLSDRRDKKDIIDSEYGLNFINSLRPVQYTWDKRVLVENDSKFINNGKKRLGFIAQDLQDAMGTKDNDILDLIYESNPERLEVKYGNLIPILTKAIQDLSNRVDKLEQYIQFNSI